MPFSVICFRYKGTDDQNKAIIEKVNATGRVFFSHTALNGRIVLRIAIGNMATQWEDLQETWGLIQQAADEIGRSGDRVI